MKQTSEIGRSLLEMLAVIGIISVLTIGAINATGFITRYYQATQLHTEVEEIANNILDLYSWSKNFGSGNITETACKNDVFPRCKDDNSAGISPWNGDIEINSTGTGFTITYKNVSRFICQQIGSNIDKYLNVTPSVPANCPKDGTNITFTY